MSRALEHGRRIVSWDSRRTHQYIHPAMQAQLASAQDKSPSSQEPAKAAKLLSDIAAEGLEADLSGLKVVEADEDFLRNSLAEV